MYIELVKNWNIENIIPAHIAMIHAEALDKNSITKKELYNKVWNSKLWGESKNGLSWLQVEGAFGEDWTFSRGDNDKGFMAINNLTWESFSLSSFEMYVIQMEFIFNKLNSLHINAFDHTEIKDGKKYINGEYIEDIKPLGKIEY